MITFDKNANMKGVKKGDFVLDGNILKCRVLVSYDSDETYDGVEFMWSECAIPMSLISYYSLHINDKGMTMKGQIIISLDDGKDIICRGTMEDLTDLYNTHIKNDRIFKFN